MMKTLRISVLLLLFAALLTAPILAAGEFATAYDLFLSWGDSNYPSYVCGVYSTDGSTDALTIALTDDDAAQVERAVRERAQPPSDLLDRRVLEEIDKN